MEIVRIRCKVTGSRSGWLLHRRKLIENGMVKTKEARLPGKAI